MQLPQRTEGQAACCCRSYQNKEEPSKVSLSFFSLLLLNSQYRVLPRKPFSSHSSQKPSRSKWVTSHHTVPTAGTPYPLCHGQGSCLRGDSRWDPEGGKCISQLYYLPCGFPFGNPTTAGDGCCEKQLPCALRWNRQGSRGGAPRWVRQKESVLSLGVYSSQHTLMISSTGSPFQLSL